MGKRGTVEPPVIKLEGFPLASTVRVLCLQEHHHIDVRTQFNDAQWNHLMVDVVEEREIEEPRWW